MDIPSVYDPTETEDKWYSHWMEKGYFHSEPDDREPFTIVIPPPNVTGVLHMGHMLNNTIQDVLVRRARMQGKNACWVPGTDHASIATEAKVVAKLKAEGIDKHDLTRDAFLEHAWEWKEKHGGIILEQLKKLGASCDWERTRFTMEEDLSEAVVEVFIDLFNKGHIYRGIRMVNWDPEALTAVSDEEVVHKELDAKFYTVRYRVSGTDQYINIATTRPETILGDTAICVHPDDPRYTHLVGKTAIVPIVNREVPIIADAYVDMELGTGALKITPAHDPNDYEIGLRHNLTTINVLNDNGTLNEAGAPYTGMDRVAARNKVAEDLEASGDLLKVDTLLHKVGTSERTNAVIEPKLSLQWFLKMEDLAKPALEHVMSDEIQFHPPKFKNSYRHWMENVKDWCISRQLWWGQRIPAWYFGEGPNDFVVAKTQAEALEIARKQCKNPALTAEDIRQDEDVVDTWFSSWLWPISVFDGFKNPDNPDINYYYPTNDLVTAPEIMFFWVARMIMAGYEYKGEKPFKNVYYTGIVRDDQRRKMSKQLGNSPNPIDLINYYGADGVRVGMLLSSPAGNDLLFPSERVDEAGNILTAQQIKAWDATGKETLFNYPLCVQGRNFSNKIWNALRLVKAWNEDTLIEQPESAAIAIRWFESQFNTTLVNINDQYGKFRMSDALMASYKLLWDDFCSWYLEMIKPAYQQPIDSKTLAATIDFFERVMKVLHPFIPFLTEEVWERLGHTDGNDCIMNASWPEVGEIDETLITDFARCEAVVAALRSIRKEKNLPNKDALQLLVVSNTETTTAFDPVISKLGNLESLTYVDEKVERANSFIVGGNEYYVPLAGLVDAEDEIRKLTDELDYTRDFLQKIQKKLSNQGFVSNAPEQVIAAERAKEADLAARIRIIEEQMAAYQV